MKRIHIESLSESDTCKRRRIIQEDETLGGFMVADNESGDSASGDSDRSYTLSPDPHESGAESGDFREKLYLDSLSPEKLIWFKQEEQRLNQIVGLDIPIKYRILELQCPDPIKIKALKLLKSYHDDSENNSSAMASLDIILQIPWGVKYSLPVTISDSYEKIMTFLSQSSQYMNDEVYGHDNAKSEISEYLTSMMVNPTSSRIIGLVGPPGIGKTSLVMNGCAKALGNIPFHSISLGGSKDVSFLTGSLPVWKGSHQGILADILISTGCMNPIIYFDEVDKTCYEHRSDVQTKLIHMTDPAQNHKIRDNFLGVELDLSNVTFIFSYNDSSCIHPALLDRIKSIELDGFGPSDKVVIMKNYVIPRIMKDMSLPADSVIFTSETIEYANKLIENAIGIDQLSGVRHLFQTYQTLLSRILTNIFANEKIFCKFVGREYIKSNTSNTHTANYAIKNFKLPYKPSKQDIKFLLQDKI